MLRPEDDRSQFRSGDLELDRFFVRFAGQNQFRHHIGATYVAVDECRVVGFATVAPGQVEVAALPEANRSKFPRYPLPVLRLARLAVDVGAQGKGLGSLLLVTVFELAHEMARTAGCVGVVVDAKAEAVSFYARLGLRPMDVRAGALDDHPEPTAMFLHLTAIPKIQGRTSFS